MKIANFGPFIISHLEHNLHQKLIVFRVVSKEWLLAKISQIVFAELPRFRNRLPGDEMLKVLRLKRQRTLIDTNVAVVIINRLTFIGLFEHSVVHVMTVMAKGVEGVEAKVASALKLMGRAIFPPQLD